ncbi:hypothetical protein X291_04320 [Oenococcus oeni IOEB_C23]|uniref:glycosyltransferase n=1 Tax=Oenococcus oeni TaxID=1247 RepID=UPI00050F63BD|nr:glycosyltransferase [Oenococcus oeni]KGH65879.1 hypothetical protein X291_04320 [Oenococcus oeni IOEB_C23]OIM54912.1 hypothetical protein ATX80_07170 [Oenococcus oeni]
MKFEMLEKQKMRILLVNTGDGIFDGVSQIEYNWWKTMPSSLISYDFLTLASSTFGLYRQELIDHGSVIFDFQDKRNRILRNLHFVNYLFNFFKANHYDIVHINSGMSLRSLIMLFVLKCFKVKVIFHAHSSVFEDDWKQKFFRKTLVYMFYHLSDLCIAVSKVSAYTFFPKKYVRNHQVKIINNGIDLPKFKFNVKDRKILRSNYQIKENDLLIGFIGRFIYQKNPEFVARIFLNLSKQNKRAKLLMIGEGPLKEKVLSILAQPLRERKVIMMNDVTDIARYYQMLDILLMPSRFEGLPLVAVEAQASGLNLIVSKKITREVIVNKSVYRLDADKDCDINRWVDQIDMIFNLRSENRLSEFKQLQKSKFSQKNFDKKIISFYYRLLRRSK